MEYYCVKMDLTPDVVNYLNRIGVSIIPEAINGVMYLRLECPEGTKEESANVNAYNDVFRVELPSKGVFYVTRLPRPPLPNGQKQHLLHVFLYDMKRMEERHANPES